jgi:phage-related protein
LWEIELYSTDSGQEVVADFLDSLPVKHKAKAIREIELLAVYGTSLTMPYVRHIEGQLWELRIKFANDISRIFYFMPNAEKIILLHGFVKKTDKIPKVEKEIAIGRMRDYKGRCLS